MNNFNSHASLSSAPLMGVDERSEAFIDDIMEGIVDPATDSLLRLSGQKPSQMTPISPNMMVRPPPNIKNHLREIMEEARSFHDSEEATRRDKELSFYALDVENIEELIRTQKVKNPQEYSVFRVMHCSRLTSMKGVSLFVNLRELNLSSNGLLSTGFLDGVKNLEILNLSCNKLT
jgi:Leucine-rich repeat (LRR) protein